MDPSHFSKTAPARRLSLGANDMGWNVEDSAAASDLGVSLDATTNVSLDAGANESDQDGGRDAVMVVPAAGQDAELSLFVEGGEPPDGPFGPDPRAQSRGWGWKGDGPRPWWSPMAMGYFLFSLSLSLIPTSLHF